MDVLKNLLAQSGIIPLILLFLRGVTPVLALYVVWRSFTSFQRGQRRQEPVVTLWDEGSGTRFPVLYWENSIGRSKSCDIYLPDVSVSRDHAVFMRRDEGWIICDTGSKYGVKVNGKDVEDKAVVNIGDKVSLGRTTLTLWNADTQPAQRRRYFTGFSREAATPFKLMFVATMVHFLMACQASVANMKFAPMQFLPFFATAVIGWGLYAVSMGVLHRVSFEIETVAFLLSGIGIMLLSVNKPELVLTQIGAMLGGVVLFSFLLWFMNDMDRVAKYRLAIGVGALLLFTLNMVLGTEVNGSKNWIYLGPVSIQPSEFIKIAFIFVGTSTLDKLQTKKNITEFIIFAAACIGFLVLMRDFGTAVIFFMCFLIIAFMRSGSIRTIILVCTAAGLGLFLVLRFKPYVAERFMGWGHVWDYINESFGYQQTRVLTYLASGGLFGVGLGQGYLGQIFASESDLIFGMLCEDLGLLMGLVVVAAIGMFILYARSNVTRSRSTYFSIASCAVAGMLLFQCCLNVFGSTDVLPLTGVTLPFLSAGGSSMMSVWALMAFLKASDERTYAARRAPRRSRKRYYEEAPYPMGDPNGR